MFTGTEFSFVCVIFELCHIFQKTYLLPLHYYLPCIPGLRHEQPLNFLCIYVQTNHFTSTQYNVSSSVHEMHSALKSHQYRLDLMCPIHFETLSDVLGLPNVAFQHTDKVHRVFQSPDCSPYSMLQCCCIINDDAAHSAVLSPVTKKYSACNVKKKHLMFQITLDRKCNQLTVYL